MPIDKSNLDLELRDDLTMMVVRAKLGTNCYYNDVHTGEERLTHLAEEYYYEVSEAIEELLIPYLNSRDVAPDSPHQLNAKQK